MSSDTEVKVNIKALAPKDDLSVEKNPSFKVYNAALDSAFSDPKICNLALSGSLGSGKSSIIRSFDRKRNGEQRFIYVSLVDFSKAVAGENKEAYDQKQLEYSLLSQIHSYCTSDDLPEGSIHGIPEKFQFLDFFAKSLTLLFLVAFVLIFHEQFGALADMFGLPDYLRSNAHLMLYLVVAIVLCNCLYHALYRCLPYLRISKLLLKSSVAEAEVNLSKEQTTLDTHKFELAYILEQIGEKHDYTVVFDDLERLDDLIAVDIMTKLRELNTLTNNHLQAQGITHHIRFLYAISDKTMPAEYRTKFYDCIIPVIPVSHPLNSNKHLQKILHDLELGSEWEAHLCDALSEAFVDYRTLLSLQNEFQVLRSLYRAAHDTSSSSETSSCNDPFLLAITAYRILMPEWFERTLSPQGDGILPDFSSSKEEAYFEQKNRAKAHRTIRKLFDCYLLDETSMRLIIGEQALIEQWIKVILTALDTSYFNERDEARIRVITNALRTVFKDVCPDPNLAPYAEFRKLMYERLCKLTSEDDRIQFVLTANSLAAVSRKDAPEDWGWVPCNPENYPFDFQGFLDNYFCWLSELSADLNLNDYPHATNCLNILCLESPGCQHVALQYAENISDTQDPKNIARLKILWCACPENLDIALHYAMGLANLAYSQELPECVNTVAQLKELQDTFQENQEIALAYAKGLVKLAYYQELPECANTVARLKELRDTFQENQEIALAYAKGLVKLACKQDLPKCVDTIRRLKDIFDVYQENQEITIQYANGLLNLSSKQGLRESADTIYQLMVLRDKYPNIKEIALQYTKSLVHLSRFQQLPERAITISLIKPIYEVFPECQELAQEYAKGLGNLAWIQKYAERTATISLIKPLYEAYPENQDIALEYAKGLFNISNAPTLSERTAIFDQVKELRDKYPENHIIARIYESF